MIATIKKRLDSVEINLSPREWVIHLVDEFRRYPSLDDFMRTTAKGTARDSLLFKPYHILLDQADARYPGHKTEDIRARNKMKKSLQQEYHILKLLVLEINEDIMRLNETGNLRISLIMSRMVTVVLQGIFSHTIRRAVACAREYKVSDKDKEINRLTMLKRLAVYEEKWSDSILLPKDVHQQIPSVLESCIADLVDLTANVLVHHAAVQAVQERYFDSHPILFRDIENGLTNVIKSVEDGIVITNIYLESRGEPFKTEWELDEEEKEEIVSVNPGKLIEKPTIDIEIIRSRAVKIGRKIKADAWIKTAKDRALMDIIDDHSEREAFIWNNFKENVVAKT
jgi:hypothetical protein